MIFIALLLSLDAQADSDFQKDLGRLEANQRRLDHLLKGVGVGGFPAPASNEDRQEKPRGPLFQVHSDLSSAQIPSGKLYFAKLVNRLVIGGDGSPVIAELDEGQGFASGLRVIGIARQAGMPGRVSIELNRLLLRTGKAVALQATGMDAEGGFGLAAQVLSGKAWAVAGALASSFISGLAAGQQTQATNILGFSQVQPTGRNAVLQGVAQTAADQSKRLVEEATAEKPILIVEPRTPVTILIQEEVRL